MSSLRQLLRAYRLLPEQIVRLGPELFDRLEALAGEQGRSVEAVVVEVLHAAVREFDVQTDSSHRWYALTPREQQVAALACLGYTNDEIASDLVISVNTVRTHMRAILDKFDVASKGELRVRLAHWDFAGWMEAEGLPARPITPEE